MPKQVLSQDAWYVFRAVRYPLDIYSLQAYQTGRPAEASVDKTHVVGDIIVMDLLKPPPAPTLLRAKKWSIRSKSSSQASGLPKFNYPSTVSTRCIIKVPDYVVMTSDVTLCAWDNELQEWTAEGISDFQYLEATHQIQCYLLRIGTFALLKRRQAGSLYRHWSLSPVRQLAGDVKQQDFPGSEWYERRVHLSISTPMAHVVIEICGTHAILKKPDGKPFANLLDKPFSAAELLRYLRLNRTA